jgi:hypothetical protein
VRDSVAGLSLPLIVDLSSRDAQADLKESIVGSLTVFLLRGDMVSSSPARTHGHESVTDYSEEGLNDVDDLILGVEHRQQTPFIKGQARVRDIEADHVAYAKIILCGDLQVPVLIHHFAK